MKMIELYKHLLAAGNCIVDDEGMVSGSMKGKTMPLMVGGKRLVLPTAEHLAHPDPSNKVIFHPLSENILGGESKVMEKFRGTINVRLNWVLACLLQELMGIVTSVKLHPKLSPTQSELLSKVKSADLTMVDVTVKDKKVPMAKAYKALKDLIDAMNVTSKDKCFVHIFLRRGGRVAGKSYRSAAIVSFPLYEELAKGEKQVFGVTLRAKDREAIMQLLEFVIPGIEVPHSYDKGSECDIAPFLDALMKSLMGIASNINAIVDEFENHLSEDAPGDYKYGDQWVSIFDNLSQMLPEIRMIPMQAGNEGHRDTRPVGNPNATGAPALVNAAPPAPHQPAVAAPNTIAYPPAFPQQAYAPAAYPAMPQPAGPVKTESGKIDFAASMRSNPVLAQQLNSGMGQVPYGQQFYQPPPPPGPATARMGAPRWDQPAYMVPPPGYAPYGQQVGYGQPPMQAYGPAPAPYGVPPPGYNAFGQPVAYGQQPHYGV